MNEKLAIILEKLDSDGIEAFYAYLVIEYATTWIVIGLTVFAVRALWDKFKETMK